MQVNVGDNVRFNLKLGNASLSGLVSEVVAHPDGDCYQVAAERGRTYIVLPEEIEEVLPQSLGVETVEEAIAFLNE